MTSNENRAMTPRSTTRRLCVPAAIGALVLAPVLAVVVVAPAGAATSKHGATQLAGGHASSQALKAAKAAAAKRAAAARKAADRKAAAKKAGAKKADGKAKAKNTASSTSIVVSAALFTNGSYPYANAAPTGGDTLNMGVRQCTSFAAWALTREGVKLTADPTGGADLVGPKGVGHLDDARTWADAAKAAGYAVNDTPAVGAIAEWNANEKSSWAATSDGQPGGYLTAGAEGHVGVVVAVNADGSAVIRDYNGWVAVGYSQHSERAARYLHIGVK